MDITQELSRQAPRSKNRTTHTLQFIAAVTFLFAVVKMPLEMKILFQSAPARREQTLDDFYNPHLRQHSAVDQHIDARRSYHFFHRKSPASQQRSLQAVQAESSSILDNNSHPSSPKTMALELLEDAALAHKVEDMVVRYLDHHHENNENDKTLNDNEGGPRNLRRVMDNDIATTHTKGITVKRKQDDPFDGEFKANVQKVVNRYATSKHGI